MAAKLKIKAKLRTKAKRRAKTAAAAVVAVDGAVAEAVEPVAEHGAVRAVGFVSEIGDQPPMRILCGGAIVAGLLLRDARLARAGVRMLAAHSLATGIKSYIKHRVDRTRPFAGGSHAMKRGSKRGKRHSSFPSGHTAGAVAVAAALARDYPEHQGKAFAAAGAVAAAQIPRSAHYPTDVGAGVAIGLVADAAVELAVAAGEALAARVRRD